MGPGEPPDLSRRGSAPAFAKRAALADRGRGESSLRVLHLHSGNLYGGVETLLVTLARQRQLCPAMEPHFALCFAGRLGRELADTGAALTDLGPVRVRRPWSVWRARGRLRELLRGGAADVVVCHNFWSHAIFAPVVRACGVPLVFWSHDVPSGGHWLHWWAGLTPPDLVLANSRYTLASVPRLFPASRAEPLHYPVATAPREAGGAATAEARAEIGTPGDAAVIIQACRLERWKGHRLLLAALGRLHARRPWECWIAGGPQRPHEAAYLEELRGAARGLNGRVRFLGQRADVPRLLAAADVHCQPNTGPEPFGIAFVEALYAGLPVVTTALGAAPEVVDGSCGVLVPPADAGALAEALAGLIDDDSRRRRLGQGGPARARHLCEPAAQLRRMHELLTPLAGARAGRAV